MIVALIAAFGLFGHHGPVDHRPPVKLYQERFEGWRLNILQDGYAERTTCRLFNARSEARARAVYEDGRVTFRFPDRVETRDAVYRLDDGPPRDAGAYMAEPLRPRRYAIAATVDSTTGGLVVLPMEQLRGATSVDIRPNLTTRPKRFDLRGLAPALQSARARGCTL